MYSPEPDELSIGTETESNSAGVDHSFKTDNLEASVVTVDFEH